MFNWFILQCILYFDYIARTLKVNSRNITDEIVTFHSFHSVSGSKKEKEASLLKYANKIHVFYWNIQTISIQNSYINSNSFVGF